MIQIAAGDSGVTAWDKAFAALQSSTTAHVVLQAATAHPRFLLGVLAGLILTAAVHTVRRIRRLITTALVVAIAGGGAAGSGETLLHYLATWRTR